MKTYRVSMDIAVKDEENEDDVADILDSRVASALREDGTVVDLFFVEEGHFADVDRTAIFEIARVAITNNPDAIGEALDLSDDELDSLLSKIEGAMG